jgi:hypothetical protein
VNGRLTEISAVMIPAPEQDMGGLLRLHTLDAFVSQGPQVNALEQPLALTQQHR